MRIRPRPRAGSCSIAPPPPVSSPITSLFPDLGRNQTAAMRGDGKPQAIVARNATWCDFLPAAKQQIPRNENAALRDDNSLAILKLHHQAQYSRIGTFRESPV